MYQHAILLCEENIEKKKKKTPHPQITSPNLSQNLDLSSSSPPV